MGEAPPEPGSLLQKLVHIRGSHHINAGVDHRRNRLALCQVIQDIDALNAHCVWPLTDESVAGSLLQDFELFRKRIERYDHKFICLDIVRVLADRAKVSLWSTEKRPSAREEKAVEIGISRQRVLDDLD